ncbi:MAG: DegT/DnrJ/EryC1/StrS family aminotransferase [Treponemataceae bacterium]
MSIPLFSSTIKRPEMEAVLNCLVEEKVGPGEMAERLEKRTCEFFNVPYALALRSPALALDLALKLLALPEKAIVMLSALAPVWQYTQVLRSGFTPLVLDVDKKNALLSFETVEAGLKAGGQVLVLHETLGNLPKFEQFLELGIPIIEDISQSAGAFYGDKDILEPLEALKAFTELEKAGGKNISTDSTSFETAEEAPPKLQKAGTFGTLTILGLEERDILTSGGGAVLFVSEKRNVSPLKKLSSEIPSTEKLPDINAALGFVQLKNLRKNMEVRLELEKLFRRALMSTKHEPLLFLPNVINPVYNFPVILNRGFKEVEKYTSKKKLQIGLAFNESIIEKFGENLENCENASSLALRTVLFPLYPMLGAKNTEMVAKVLTTLP